MKSLQRHHKLIATVGLLGVLLSALSFLCMASIKLEGYGLVPFLLLIASLFWVWIAIYFKDNQRAERGVEYSDYKYIDNQRNTGE